MGKRKQSAKQKKVTDKMKKAEWYEKCMSELIKATGNKPYNLEDICCDSIRYWTEYVPKKCYEHLSDDQKRNNSTLKVDGEYPEKVVNRIKEVVG